MVIQNQLEIMVLVQLWKFINKFKKIQNQFKLYYQFGIWKDSINGYNITLKKKKRIQFTYTELILINMLIDNEPHLINTDN